MTYPPAIRQSGPSDCELAATAYLCLLLGHPVTPEQVNEECGGNGQGGYESVPSLYPQRAFGIEPETFWGDFDRDDFKSYWLGHDNEAWLLDHLWDAYAYLHVWRGPTVMHAVVALEATPPPVLYGGDWTPYVLLMDPNRGLVWESLAWVLGSGPGTHAAHHVEAFYLRPA